MELHKMGAAELSVMLQNRWVSAVEVTNSTLARIDKVEAELGAFISINREKAMEDAAIIDAKRAVGAELGLLAGIPIALKDNICTKGIKTTCASEMLENFVPPYNATVVDKLIEQDAIIIGKLNMDEFAMGSSCETSCFHTTANPWNDTKVAGGSSGGSAAAVAALEVPLTLGSDSGGSVRIPASFCGVAGLKPTYGAVSRHGLISFASSLEGIGPMARSVDDLALLYSVISGQDKMKDSTSKQAPKSENSKLSLEGMRIGIPVEYYLEGIEEGVQAQVLKAALQLKELGARIVEISLPSTPYVLSAYYIISSAEAASNMGRYDGIRYGYSAPKTGQLDALYEATRSNGFGDEVIRRILLGTSVLMEENQNSFYKRAKLLQERVKTEFEHAFTACDIILTPTCPVTAFSFGEKLKNPVSMYGIDGYTAGMNLAGIPGISLPCGLDEKGMPVGMQLVGPQWSEERLLHVAKSYESAVGGFLVKENTNES